MKAQYKFLVITGICFLFSFSNITAQTTSVYVAAHPDDWQLFMNPNAYNSIKGTNEKVIFLHTTAGDGGNGTSSAYYTAREEGSLRAIRFMSNTFTNAGAPGINMNQATVTVNGHQILKMSYRNAVIYFLRLPDGDYGGQGYPLTGNASLQKLYNGTISSIAAINGSTTYSSLTDLENTMKAIVQSEALPSSTIKFNIADHDSSINPDDHSDHIYSSLIMQDVANSIGGVTLNLYSEYNTASRPVNVFNDNLLINAGTWGATASGISDKTFYSTWDTDHNVWLYRQYLRTITPIITPSASIVATDPDAAESPLDTGLFTVSLSSVNNTGSPITVNYTVSGSATSGSDFIALSGNVSIANGQQTKTITLTPINDALVESPETVILTLAAGTGYTVGTPSSATVTITSEDVATGNAATVIATDDVAGESPLNTGKFTISLATTNTTGSDIIINYSLSGTATAGVDYTGLTGSTSIANGQISKILTLTPINDTEVEPTETAILTITSGTGYVVGSPASATINISSEDVAPNPPSVSIVASDAYAAESPLDTGSFNIVLNEVNTGAAITVNFSIGGTASPGIDYTSFSGSVTFNTGQQSQTIIITPINDTEVENSETVVLTLTSGTGYTVGTPSSAIVNIESEDVTPPPTTNLALNKPTTASLSNEKPSSRAVDNIYTLSNWWGASPYPQWWRVDLGNNYDISKVVVFNYYDGTRYYKYDIQGSLDGNTWTTLVDFNANTSPATSAGNTFNLSNPTARYLRVNMNYNSANVGVHIIEFEAYGVLNTSASKDSGSNVDVFGSQNMETTRPYSLLLYPNPNKRGASIKMDLQLPKEETAFVEIFDLLGKKLLGKEYNLKEGFNEIEIPSNEFASGIFMVRVNIQGEIITKKLFIE